MNGIREDESIIGIEYKEKIKISLVANDTLLTIEDPQKIIERVKSQLRGFGEITSLHMNWNKPEIMLYNCDKEKKIIKKKRIK